MRDSFSKLAQLLAGGPAEGKAIVIGVPEASTFFGPQVWIGSENNTAIPHNLHPQNRIQIRRDQR
jgi:hypothetical protein